MQPRKSDGDEHEGLLAMNFDDTALPTDFRSARWKWLRGFPFLDSMLHQKNVSSQHISNPLLLLIGRFLYALVPQLIRTKWFNDPVADAKIHATSWMDGIRGLAAIAVLNQHYFARFTNTVFYGYGVTPTDTWIHQLPVIELFYDAGTGLQIFFIIGGYVCAYKPLQAIARRDDVAFVKTLSASAFRRWFRLYLPTICLTICTSTLAWWGVYEPTHFLYEYDDLSKIFPGRPIRGFRPRFATVSRQIAWWWDGLGQVLDLRNEYPDFPTIGAHLWTILEMFRASMHLYVVLLALALCKEWARTAILLLLCYIYGCLWYQPIPVAFFGGAILAQIDIQRRRREDPKQRPADLQQEDDVTSETTDSSPSAHLNGEFTLPTISSLSRSFAALVLRLRRRGLSGVYGLYNQRPSDGFRFVLYVLALYMMSFPLLGARFPSLFHKHLVPFIPGVYDEMRGSFLPKQIGVALFMYLLSSLPEQQRSRSLWHRFLTSGPCQYLGTIMFAVYLVHPTLQITYGFALPHFVWRTWNAEANGWEYAAPEGLGIYVFGVVVGWAGCLAGTLWVADVWTREVEERCMKVTKKLEQWLFIKT